jgi:hypothetical protein
MIATSYIDLVCKRFCLFGWDGQYSAPDRTAKPIGLTKSGADRTLGRTEPAA